MVITVLYILVNTTVFKASALWADEFYKLICLSVCLFVCMFVRLFTFKLPLKCLFAPTSRSWMSKDSESLGKTKWKKWSHIWQLLLIKGVNSPLNFFFFFLRIYSWSIFRGHRNGVKFCFWGHWNKVKKFCRGHWNDVKFGCWGHPKGVKFQSQKI